MPPADAAGAPLGPGTTATVRPRPSHLGQRYVIGESLGEGGMGVVVSAFDKHLGRIVALKVARTGEGRLSEEFVGRFLGEAQITGQLEHPNIVPVHELGEDLDGNLYFSMKRIEGITLAHLIDEVREKGFEGRDYTLQRVLHIMLKVCEAIAFAHARGVIHRDLKPSNVMIGSFGEVLVVDWGLAKAIGTPDGVTPPPREDALRAAQAAAASGSPRERDAAATPPEGVPVRSGVAAPMASRAPTEPAPVKAAPDSARAATEPAPVKPAADSARAATDPAPAGSGAGPAPAAPTSPPPRREARQGTLGNRSSSTSVQVVPHALTQMGTIMGTLEYMPPEQALGHVKELDERADVYALGALLYEVMTLRPPFEAPNDRELVRRIVHGELIRPSRRARQAREERAASPSRMTHTRLPASAPEANASAPSAGPEIAAPASFGGTLEVPPELEAVVLKAMAVKPERRYPTVEALRRDLLAFLDGLPVSAYREGPLRRASKWLRRHPTLLATLVTTGVLLLAGGATAFVVLRAQEQERIQLLEKKVDAEAVAAAEARKRNEVLEEQRKGAEVRARAYDSYQQAIDALRNRRPGSPVLHWLEEAARIDPTFIEGRDLLAQTLLRAGRVREAIDAWREVARLQAEQGHPNLQARALYWIGQAHLEYLQDAAGARGIYEELARLAPDDVFGRVGQAYVHAIEGRYPEALGFALEAEKQQPDYWEVCELLGFLYGQRQVGLTGAGNPLYQPDKALEYMTRGIALRDDLPRMRVNRATLLWQMSRPDEVGADLDRALELEPQNANAWSLLGVLRRHQRRLEEAVAAHSQALALIPARVDFAFNRAWVYLEMGKVAEALADYDRFLSVAPDHPTALARRAFARLRAGDVTGARADLDHLVRVSRESESSYGGAASMALSAGHPALALEYALQGLARFPESIDLHEWSGQCHLRLGEEDAAIQDLDFVAAHQPGTAANFLRLGNAAFDVKSWEIANRYYDQGLALEPAHRDLLWQRASSAFNAGDYAGSIQLYTRVLDVQADHVESLMYRGAAWRELKKWDEAQRDLDRAVALAPAGSEAGVERGILREKRGQIALALEDFERCIMVHPAHARAIFRRGALRINHGEPQAGEADLVRAVELGESDAFWWLAQWRFQNGETEQAQAVLDALLRRWPEDRARVDAWWKEREKGK